MAGNVGLYLEVNNKLVISPQMYQAMEMIQLALPELIDYINNELVENPLLEASEEYDQISGEKELKEENNPDAEKEAKLEAEDKWLDGIVEALQENKDNWIGSALPNGEAVEFEGCWQDNNSLQEYLLEQLRFMEGCLSEQEYQTAEYLIGNLDSNGYLATEIEEVAQSLQTSSDVVLKALEIVQRLDPPGVGARNLQECLKLQFNLIPDCPPKMEKILDYLDELAAGHFKKIASALGITTSEVKVMGELLRLLDPKPGSRFDSLNDTRYIVPDAVIKKVENEYLVLVNESDLPRISINEGYKRALQEQGDDEVKKFVRDKLSSALNLIKNIEHRRSTIHDVLETIAQRQTDFLDHGTAALKPLTMKEVADELGIHESTVSRIAANKYVQTPRGLCAIKCFFAGSIGRETEVTAERIKEDIKRYIAKEDLRKPYSDQDLADLFQKNGINIARRTIAKYREELFIPSSSLRKRANSGS